MPAGIGEKPAIGNCPAGLHSREHRQPEGAPEMQGK
jgi:hypothetical protein